MNIPTAVIDRVPVPIEGERNLLELIRKAGTELPTFCYHSEISVYGACRMCMVEVEGRGLLPACSTRAEDGMVVRTSTAEIRSLRRTVIELTLAAHGGNCTECPKGGDCRLQSVARRLGVTSNRFKPMPRTADPDESSDCVLRDPSKCILCGDCVRVCDEIQSVGALDFVYRGARAQVSTCFNRGLGHIECVGCGQCVKVCPVGALTAKSEIRQVWDAIFDPEKTVVVQVAPAVRVALGEYFGKSPGWLAAGRAVTALRRMGFDRVYDTCFGADFTVVEEGDEFLARLSGGGALPLFTSCCPAWVRFVEQYYPDFLDNLSSCRSPQAMFGALCKDRLAEDAGIPRKDLVVVTVSPCTAKKAEARRPQLSSEGTPDVDHVITTGELALMIKESGMDFAKLELGSFDMPFGFVTGASVIFGASGGVSEAVLRYAAEKLERGSGREFRQFRGFEGVKTAEIALGGRTLRMAAVSGLGNARKLIDAVRKGEAVYDLIEVMACPGGCVNGGGQPVSPDFSAPAERAKGLFDTDKMLQFHESSENPYLKQVYSECLGGGKAHRLFHTGFECRRRIDRPDFTLGGTEEERPLSLEICFGTSCYLRGAQKLYKRLMDYIRDKGLESRTAFKASFCGKSCMKGPVLKVNGHMLEKCTLDDAASRIQDVLNL
jgi:NADH-quinone oxidoreductase subunit G